MTLPDLSTNRRARHALLFAMFFAQGLDLGLVVVALPAYLAERGVSALAIGGFVTAMVLPWTLKVCFAPLMERYVFLAMGRRRPWILLGALGGVLAYAAAALLPDPLGHLGLFTAVLVAASTFLAIQDIAANALAVDLVPADELTRANSLMWGGEILGVAVASAMGAWLLQRYALSTVLLGGAGALAVLMVPVLLLREWAGECLLPWTAGQASAFAKTITVRGWGQMGRELQELVLQPASLLLLLVGLCSHFNEGLLEAFGPVFTVRKLGWTAEAYANIKALSQLVGGLIGILAGGLLVRRCSTERGIQVAVMAMGLLCVVMGFGEAYWSSGVFVGGYLVAMAVAQVMLTVFYFATVMRMCRPPVAAVQLALFVTVTNVGYVVGAGAMAPLRVAIGAEGLYLVMALVAAGAAGIVGLFGVASSPGRVVMPTGLVR